MNRGRLQPNGQLTFVAMPTPTEDVTARQLLQWGLRPEIYRYVRIHLSPVTLNRRLWLAPKATTDMSGWVTEHAPINRGKAFGVELKRSRVGELMPHQRRNLEEMDRAGARGIEGRTIPQIEAELFLWIGLVRDDNGSWRAIVKEEAC